MCDAPLLPRYRDGLGGLGWVGSRSLRELEHQLALLTMTSSPQTLPHPFSPPP